MFLKRGVGLVDLGGVKAYNNATWLRKDKDRKHKVPFGRFLDDVRQASIGYFLERHLVQCVAPSMW